MPDCIIPAGGHSSRMGRWKPGLPWGEQRTIVGSVVSEALSAGCRVIVAGGYRFQDLKKMLSGYDSIVLVEAADWEQGMDVTIGAALDLIDSDRFFITPADMPFVRADDYFRLAEIRDAECVRPIFSDIPGHPVLIESRLISRLKQVSPGTPLKSTLGDYDVRLVSWDHSGVIRDIDTLSDYTAADSL